MKKKGPKTHEGIMNKLMTGDGRKKPIALTLTLGPKRKKK